jgi:hypothetical protein
MSVKTVTLKPFTDQKPGTSVEPKILPEARDTDFSIVPA